MKKTRGDNHAHKTMEIWDITLIILNLEYATLHD